MSESAGIPKGAGAALLEAVEASRQQSDRRARFQDWLGAYTLATHIVGALARRPGLRDVEGARIRDAFQKIAQASERGYRQIKRQLERGTVSLTDPGHQMQVKRLVFEAVAREWPDQADEPPALFRAMPGQDDRITEDFGAQIALLQGYLHEVAELVEQQGETPPGERAMAEDYHLDRVLAAHSMYLRAHDALVPFFDQHLRAQPQDWRVVVAGETARRETYTATDLVHQVVSGVILPIVDERHAHLLGTFDPKARFGAHDRHLAYRALVTNVTGDAVSAIAHQSADLIDECQSRYDRPLPGGSPENGVLTTWLTGQINYRLDWVYPRPDEYIDGGH